MKTRTKKIIFFSLCLIIAGAVLLGVGMLFGGRPGVILSSKGIESPYKTNEPYVLEKTKLDSFSNVDLKIGSYADLQILPSVDGRFYLEYKLDSAYGEPFYEVKNNTLTLVHRDDRTPFGGIRFFYISDFTEGMDVNTYINLYIPEDAKMGKLDVYNDCGDVFAEGLTFGDSKLKVSYGDAKFQDMTFQDLEIVMESGKCKVENLTAQDLVLKNEYGDVSLESMTVLDAEIKLESGKLTADGFSCVNLAARSEYGNVEIDDFSAKTADFILDSGNLQLDAVELTNLTCKNEYGDVKLKLPKDLTEYSISARSDYGHIDIPKDAPGQHIDSDDNVVYKTSGKSEGTIKIEVESGDIVIE